MISKYIKSIGLAVIIIFCFISIFIPTLKVRGTFQDNAIEKLSSYLDDNFYDMRMYNILKKNRMSKDIVLAEIDDQSLYKIGRWPWSRSKWAKFIGKMKIYGAKVIAFDIMFSEPEKSCSPINTPDDQFAKSIEMFGEGDGYENNMVIFPYTVDQFMDPSKNLTNPLPQFLQDFMLTTHVLDKNVNNSLPISLAKNYINKTTFPLKKLISSFSSSIGNISSSSDTDGVFRRYPLALYAGKLEDGSDIYLKSLGLEAYSLYTESKSDVLTISLDQYTLKTSNHEISLTDEGTLKIRWFGDHSYFPRVSLHKIFSESNNSIEMKKIFKGKIVFVGSSATGAHDLRHSPIATDLPGVYSHMNVVQMLIDNYFLQDIENSINYSWMLLLIVTIILILVQTLHSALYDITIVTILLAATYTAEFYYFMPNGYEIKLSFILIAIVACYSWNTLINFYLTSKDKKKIRGAFSKYVAPAIVNEMLANPEKMKVGGEKKNITVIFSDVRDFTSISERLSPEGLSKCLNQYMGRMTDILFETYGTLDKYIGDAIVGYWGAPLDLENHAYHGVRGAVQMIEELPLINEKFKEQGFPEFKVGIGLNSGDCSVGNMGSDQIFSYTALGDNMNLGARLEGLCKFYGVQINISEYTKDAIPAELQKEFVFRILDKVKVKGKEKAVIIFEVLHNTHPFRTDKDALETYRESFKLYNEREFKKSVELLTPIANKYPEDKSSARIIEACNKYIANPPSSDWDGVTVYNVK